MTGRQDAIQSAAAALSHGYTQMLGLDGTTVTEAADAAYTPTGPDRAHLEHAIQQRRNELHRATA